MVISPFLTARLCEIGKAFRKMLNFDLEVLSFQSDRDIVLDVKKVSISKQDSRK